MTITNSELSFAAPGRVNLIGEHTDYTGGLVMPIAIPFATVASIRKAEDGNYSFASEMFAKTKILTPGDRSEKTGDWTDYPVGVLRQLQALGIHPPPFRLRLDGHVPLGAGLSSSASVEVATAMALLAHSGVTLPTADVARLCQRAENEYVHSPCGIMDQFVITAAVRGHALLLNTRDLTYELLPMNQGDLAECRVVIANSGVKHSISGGEYGRRRHELEIGQKALLNRFPELRDLGDATYDHLAKCTSRMSLESYRRCHHIISENGRVRRAREAMLTGDPVALGRIITAAHASERDDFECSVEEVDFLVDIAVRLSGCFGARLTGGGFGGCTVNLVAAAATEGFTSELRLAYANRFGRELKTYICEAVDGAARRAELSFASEVSAC